jgi:DNA polymerase-3 subunit alpha
MTNQIIENKWNNRKTIETKENKTGESVKDFVHLHLHTDYSMMDGCQKPEQLFNRIKALGQKKLAITNHGNMINMPQLIEKGAKEGIQVIPGCELYVCWDYSATQKDDEHKKTYHMIVLAKDEAGYRNLIKLTSKGYLQGKYYKPRVDRAMLEEHSEGLIVLTACLNGTLANQLAKQDKCAPDLYKDVEWLQEVFEDRVYLEVQRHPNLEIQDVANAGVELLSKKYDIPMVATCDAHYSVPQHFEAWQSMMLLQTGMRFGHDLENDYYVKSAEEMYTLWADQPEVCDITNEIANRCEPIVFDKSIKYPPFCTGKMSADDYLLAMCREGLDEKIRQGKVLESQRKDYEKRYLSECKILADKNFSTYILIVADYTTWAKDQGILMAPGRGSGCGSLVLWLTRTTEVDPIPYACIFERFINPERNSFPDIDQDFQDDRRQEVIDYFMNKYGVNNTCKIGTIGTLAAKGAIREICRRFELPFAQTNEFAKLIPGPIRGRNVTLVDAVKSEPRFADALKDPMYKKIFDIACVIEGMAKSTGTHAAGVIASDGTPLWDSIALQVDKEGAIVSADGMKVLEDLGFIKFDFLGLTTLTVIQRCIAWIKKNYDIDIDIYNLPLDDPKVYDMICRGEIEGMFQLGGSSGFIDVTMKMGPRSIENISDINAVYRPGPLDNGFVEKYAENKLRVERGMPIEYMMVVDNPEKQKLIENILKGTYGVCLYQEQIQFIAQQVAGYTLGGADLLRRAIGKKIQSEMEEQRANFLKGCTANGVSKGSANELFDQIAKFADYCFNKSHSVAYSITGYWTAWLKYYYPNEFMASNLTVYHSDQDKTIGYINACRGSNIKVLPPDINESTHAYTPTDKGIRFGLGAIKGLGNAAIDPIITERETNGKYVSYYNFLNRSRSNLSKIKKSDIVTLAKTGCFDSVA